MLSAIVEAVHANDATRVVDFMLFSVDTHSFTVTTATTAAVAFAKVNFRAEQ